MMEHLLRVIKQIQTAMVLLCTGWMAFSAGAGSLIVFNDNGGWCWYQDERVIIQGRKLIIGSIANGAGVGGSARSGDIEVTTYDLDSGNLLRTTLHDNLQADDHDVPAFLELPDGRLLAMYTRHLSDSLIHCRISTNPYDSTVWGSDVRLVRGASTSYSNLFRLSSENSGSGRIYDFYRGENYNPNFIVSDDNGQTWSYGGWLVRKDGQRPYVKYASNNTDKVFFVCSNAHPREYYNGGYGGTSIFAGFVYQGGLYRMDAVKVRDITTTNAAAPEELTLVYAGDWTHRAWPTDIHLDAAGNPVMIFSVQAASSGSFDGSDLRYFYARWDGSRMQVYPLAYAGSALYSAENDYSGLAAIHPDYPEVVYISANAHPVTGTPLISRSDGKRHYEILRGTASDGGAAWTWEYITKNSTVDNIRPIIPIGGEGTILLWMRGTYSTYTSYNMQIVGMFDPEPVLPGEPEILSQPEPAGVPVGGKAVFAVEAVGLEPLHYAWYKQDSSGSDFLIAEGSAVLVLEDVQPSDLGWYYCVVSNSAGSAVSSSVPLMLADLLAYWPMDGNYQDVSGSGYDAVGVGAPVFNTGYAGQSVSLNGSSYLYCANSADLTLEDGGTISVWVKTGRLSSAWASIIGKGRYSWRLCRNNETNAVSFHFNSPSYEYQANGDIPVVDNQWHHLAAAYDGRSINLYVDGQLDASTLTPEAVNVRTDPVYIGNRSDAARYWTGLIDEVQIYSFAMNEQAVQTLYEKGLACYRLEPYDFDGNCRVDLDDIAVLSSQWLESGWNEQAGLCLDGPALDWTGPDGQPDCTVNLYELAELAAAWQECTLVPASNCP